MWSSKERKEAVLIYQQWLEWNIMNSDLNKILYYIKELYWYENTTTGRIVEVKPKIVIKKIKNK